MAQTFGESIVQLKLLNFFQPFFQKSSLRTFKTSNARSILQLQLFKCLEPFMFQEISANPVMFSDDVSRSEIVQGELGMSTERR